MQLLVEQVEYGGEAETLARTFHAAGIRRLADEILAQQQNDPKEKRA